LLILTGASAHAATPERPLVTRSVRNRKSTPLREFRLTGQFAPHQDHEIENEQIPGKLGRSPGGDKIVQRHAGPASLQALTQFEGGSDPDNDQFNGRVAPPDTNGD